jgi:hypothetical protein
MKTVLFVAMAALLSACSSGGGKPGNGSDSGSGGLCPTAVSPNACVDGCNPCTHLSDAQVAAVVGQSTTGFWNGDVCEWDYYDGQGNISFGVTFGVNYDYATFEDFCHPADPANDPYTVTPVSGVGDDACYMFTSAGALGSDLQFLKGCWSYDMVIVGPVGHSPPFSDATVQAYEKMLALDVVPTL